MLKLILIAMLLVTTGCSEASSGCSKDETLKLIDAGYSKAEIAELCDQGGKSEQSTGEKLSASVSSGDLSKQIIGTWYGQNQRNKERGIDAKNLEFLDNGVLILTPPPDNGKTNLTWAILKGGKLIIGAEGSSRIETFTIKFEGTQLVFTGETGIVARYDRL